MNRLQTACCALGLVVMAAAQAAGPGDTPAPLRSASQPTRTAVPAAQAAQNDRIASETHPAQRALPQIAIPLNRKQGQAEAGAESGGAAADGINDDAARCIAKKSKRERAACRQTKS